MSGLKTGDWRPYCVEFLIIRFYGVFRYEEKVLIVPFHKVFFPGIFFNGLGIVGKIGAYLL